MIPITELQGAIPFFLATHPELPAWFVMLAAIAGAMLVPTVVLLVLPWITDWLFRHVELRPRSPLRFLQQFIHWFYRLVHRKHSKTIERWGEFALVVITGIPLALPGSGVWTGSALAFLFNIPYKKALLFIAIGVIISASIVTAVSSGVISAAGYLQ